MIDFETYRKLHQTPKKHQSRDDAIDDKNAVVDLHGEKVSTYPPEVFPPEIYGFNLRLKKWG
jgi:hypothetical protein